MPGFGRLSTLGEQRRDALLALIRQRPGMTFRCISKASLIASGTCRHHLAVLKKRKLLWTMRQGGRLLHFPGPEPLEQERLQALRHSLDDLDKSLLDFLEARGSVIQAVLLDLDPDEARSTVQNRVHRLVRFGLAVRYNVGRLAVYRVAWRESGLGAILTQIPASWGVAA